MKKLLQITSLLCCLLLSVTAFAQSNFISYQGIASDASGALLADQSITLKISLIFKLESNPPSYVETHHVTTDGNGLFNVKIGFGTVVSGDYNSLEWDVPAFIGIAVNGTTVGTTELNAVPFALYAFETNSIFKKEGDIIYAVETNKNLVFGSSQLDNNASISSDDSRLFFNKSKSAFRAGSTEFTEWDNDNIGKYSVAFGLNNRASGYAAMAMGIGNVAHGGGSIAAGSYSLATGDESVAFGIETTGQGIASFATGTRTVASGNNATAMGFLSKASGENSFAVGDKTVASKRNAVALSEGRATGVSSVAIGGLASGKSSKAFGGTASGDYAVASGKSTNADAYISTAIGRYNVGTGNKTSWIPTEPLFEIGNGESNSNKSNALTVLKNGNVGIGTHQPKALLEVATTGTFPVQDNYTNSLSIKNSATGNSWQFFTTSYLNLYRNGIFRGAFNATSGAYSQVSDRQRKKEIKSLSDDILQKLMQLNPVSYLMKDQKDTTINMGLISQEVQEVFPSLIHRVEGSNLLALSYTELIPILIKAVQEQQVMIEKLTKSIEILRQADK